MVGNTFADFRDDEYKVIPTLFQDTTFLFQDGEEGNFVKVTPT